MKLNPIAANQTEVEYVRQHSRPAFCDYYCEKCVAAESKAVPHV